MPFPAIKGKYELLRTTSGANKLAYKKKREIFINIIVSVYSIREYTGRVKESRSTYIIFDIKEDAVRASRVLSAENTRRFEIIESFSSQNIESALKAIQIKSSEKIIISLSHRMATTIRADVAFLRVEPKFPITESELENIISRGLWKLFNQKRKVAALKMKTSDIEVKVCDADIVEVHLDGHRALNPVGFCARDIRLICQETLVVAPLLNKLLQIIPEEQIACFSEGPMAWPLLVAESGLYEKFLALTVLRDETVLYRYKDKKLESVDTFSWGIRDIHKAVSGFFGADISDAEILLEAYRNKKIGKGILKGLEGALAQEFSILLKGIESHKLDSEGGNIFINSEFNLSKIMLKKQHTLLDESWISEKFGYALKLKDSAHKNPASILAFVTLCGYIARSKDAELNKIAKQRARWL